MCNEIETVREFTYLGDRLSADEGCHAAVTARTRSGVLRIEDFANYYAGKYCLWM